MSLDIDEQYEKIYRYCYLRVRHKETAEDLTQETFLRYLEHPHYSSEDKTLQLLYTIAGNLCTDEFRKKKPTTELSDTESDGKDMEEDVLSGYELKMALDKLSSEDREIVLLRFLNGVPLNVIAKLYNISRFSLSRRINRILSSLKEYMGKEELILPIRKNSDFRKPSVSPNPIRKRNSLRNSENATPKSRKSPLCP